MQILLFTKMRNNGATGVKKQNFLNIDAGFLSYFQSKRNFYQKKLPFVYSCKVFFCIIALVRFFTRTKEGRTTWQQRVKNVI